MEKKNKARKVAVAFLEGSRKSVEIPSWLLLKKTSPKKAVFTIIQRQGRDKRGEIKPRE